MINTIYKVLAFVWLAVFISKISADNIEIYRSGEWIINKSTQGVGYAAFINGKSGNTRLGLGCSENSNWKLSSSIALGGEVEITSEMKNGIKLTDVYFSIDGNVDSPFEYGVLNEYYGYMFSVNSKPTKRIVGALTNGHKTLSIIALDKRKNIFGDEFDLSGGTHAFAKLKELCISAR
jgi:hypothetical protein